MNGDDVKTAERLRAADVVLTKMMTLREFHDVEQRLAALELRK